MWMQWTDLQALTVNPADFSSLLCTDFCTNNVITGESVLWMFWTGFCGVLKVVILRCTTSFHADKSSRFEGWVQSLCTHVKGTADNKLQKVRISTICTSTLRPTGGQFFGFFHWHPNYQVWFSFCTYANSNIALPSDACENHRHPN
jgi:hypothetical protein